MKRRQQAAFTFVEVLAALAFLGILMPVIVSALTLANRASVVSERTAVATQLADNRLNELLISAAWNGAETRGDFGQEWPGYHWELIQATWEAGEMTELTLAVFFQVQGREHDVRLTTLVSDTPTAP